MPGEFYAECQVGAAFDQQLRYGQAAVAELGGGMEDCGLAADAGCIDCCAGVDVQAVVGGIRPKAILSSMWWR